MTNAQTKRTQVYGVKCAEANKQMIAKEITHAEWIAIVANAKIIAT